MSEFDRYRKAGAVARTMLVQAAAQKFGVSPDNCRTENGYVIADKHRISYGEIATAASVLPMPNVVLRGRAEWKLVGKSKNRLDIPDKINGKAQFGLDVHIPGVLTALVAHAPVFGSKVKSFIINDALTIQGVRDVVQIPSGVAVVADNFWAAKQGRDKLKIEWEWPAESELSTHSQLIEYRKIAETKGSVVVERGDVNTALRDAKNILEFEYSFPYLAHAPMEPLNCTVRIAEKSCEVWVGTQSPLLHQAEIARFLRLQPEQVKLYTPYLGGGFGRRGSFSDNWVMEAVHIAKISGKAIKLIWTREDDIQGGYYRPVYLHRVELGIAENGFPMAWRHRIVGQSLFVNTPLEKEIVVNGIDYSCVTTGAPYSETVSNYSFELHTTKSVVPVLPWRSVGHTHKVFVIESIIDEMATRTSMDAVEYRRLLLKNSPRHLGVLNHVAEKASWGTSLPAGRFRGVAVCEAMGSYVANVVEVSINDNQININRVVCAIDCGLAVNPDGVRAQMEGGIIFGLTAALYGEITLDKGRVIQSNFHDYRMLRMKETPVIEVHIMPSDEKMGGAGEPGVPAIAPALANALFAATGKRIRKLPIPLDDVVK